MFTLELLERSSVLEAAEGENVRLILGAISTRLRQWKAEKYLCLVRVLPQLTYANSARKRKRLLLASLCKPFAI
jgi:hypothetical protein